MKLNECVCQWMYMHYLLFLNWQLQAVVWNKRSLMNGLSMNNECTILSFVFVLARKYKLFKQMFNEMNGNSSFFTKDKIWNRQFYMHFYSSRKNVLLSWLWNKRHCRRFGKLSKLFASPCMGKHFFSQKWTEMQECKQSPVCGFPFFLEHPVYKFQSV